MINANGYENNNFKLAQSAHSANFSQTLKKINTSKSYKYLAKY